MKKVKLFFVTKNKPTTDECLDNVYTIVKNKSDAREYINKVIFSEHKNHFNLWCELHNKNCNDLQTFYDYIETRYDYESNPYNDFKVITLKYDIKDLCSILRILSYFKPVGASYETQNEVDAYNTYIEEMSVIENGK